MINQPKFKKLDEGFTCKVCGRTVEPLKYSSRDHCPYCLHSLHIDINPGDRLNTCRGILKPVGIEQKNGEYIILYKCEQCKKTHKNKASKDDDFSAIIALSNYTFDDFLKKLKK